MTTVFIDMNVVISRDKLRAIIFAWFDKKYSGLEGLESDGGDFIRYLRGDIVEFYYFNDSGSLLVTDPQIMEVPFKFIKDAIDYNEFAEIVGEWFNKRYGKNVADVEI